VTIFRDTAQWKEIRGVQLTGTAAVVRSASRRRAIEEVFRKRFGLGPEFDALLATHRLYCFTPRWMRWVDNTQGFGHKTEHAFPLDG
jgi:uncharacterized protein YhbP (UPF0306 family)